MCQSPLTLPDRPGRARFFPELLCLVARLACRTLPALFIVFSVSVPAFAQGAIVGQVNDSSGAALPDVAVEATSGALIEGTRTTVTDGSGRYRIENLTPGEYDLRFSRAGWTASLVKDIELSGSFTATVNAVLTLGQLAETVTVAAHVPLVDVHRAGQELTLGGEFIQTLPTARSYNALVSLVPGVTTSVNDTVTGPATISFPLHGGRQNEGRLLLDGLTIGSPPNGNSATIYDFDPGQAREVTFTTPAGSGEFETSGLMMNLVPQTGGNTHHGSLSGGGTGKQLQADNVTPELAALGVMAPTPYTRLYDVSGTFGGPLAPDRLWYFVMGHSGGTTRDRPGVYYNLNAGNPSAWLYAPDYSRQEYSDRTFEQVSGRATWQVTRRNKVSALWDTQAICRTCSGATPGLAEPQRSSPEAVGVLGRGLDVTQATWTSPLNDHLLLDAAYGGVFFGVGNFERDPNPTRGLIRVVEQCAAGCAANGNIPGLAYRSQDFSVAHTGSFMWKAAASYVKSMHSIKAGYQHTFMIDDRTWITNDQNLTYRVANGEPNQLTESISPWVNNARESWDGLFVQGQQTTSRLTVQAALRFDVARSWFPRQQEGPSRFLPSPIVIPETRGVDSYKDITPRAAIVYDLTGTNRTAVKASIGKYLEGVGNTGAYANSNPTLRMPQTTSVMGTAGVTRAWTDANHNFAPDCDLSDPNAQDLRASGADMCGVMSNVSFGKSVLTNAFDPHVLRGWNIRPSDWDLAVSIEQQVGTRSSFNVGYYRRWFHGFTVVDNLSLQSGDLTPFSVPAPVDPRLPGGGGYVVSGLYDVVPDKAGQVDNLVTNAAAYGRWTQHYDGVDATVNGRFARSLTIAGGISAGHTVVDNCDVRAHLPELSTAATGTSVFGGGLLTSAVTATSPYCHVAFGIVAQARGFASYVVPRVDLELAATIQSKPGALLAANYAAPNSVVFPSLGRNLSGNASNVTVNLIRPGSLYGDRINQIDARIGKTIARGRSRTRLALDVYNVPNASTVLAYDTTYVPGGPWLQPMTLLTPRLFRISAEWHW